MLKSTYRISPVLPLLLTLFIGLFQVEEVRALDIEVTNTDDAGAGSLRAAITQANSIFLGGGNIIFNIPGGGPYIITLESPLPAITKPETIIDGGTQPGIVLQPNGSIAYALAIQANGCTINELEITGFDIGIQVASGQCNNIIENCTIANNLINGVKTDLATNTQLRKNTMYCNGSDPTGDPFLPSSNAAAPPEILTASESTITGTAAYLPPTLDFPDNIVEIFVAGDTACPDADVQGKTYLTEAIVNPDGTWTATGNFPKGAQLTATVTNPDNCPIPCFMTADFIYDSDLTNVFFTDFSSNGPVFWYWDFGDGEFSYEQDPNHGYADYGTYNVCLTAGAYVNGIYCEDTYCEEITLVDCNLFASYDYYQYGLEIEFVDYSFDSPTSWFWDFGDGETSTDQNPIHVYSDFDVYTVCLTVSKVVNGVLCEDTYCYDVEVFDLCQDFIANFSWANSGFCIVDFTDLTAGSPTYWEWDFDDGNFSNETNPSHGYAIPLTYNVTLYVERDVPFCYDQITKVVQPNCFSFQKGDPVVAEAQKGAFGNPLPAANAVTSDFSPVFCLEYADTLNVDICENEFYIFYGDTLNMAGTYDTMFTSFNGCDTTITLNLSVLDTVVTELSATICENEFYVYESDSLNVGGIYTYGYLGANGC
ncbi:MAG: PKD domain-containing protein, partial [Bacteroidetes bacterium]